MKNNTLKEDWIELQYKDVVDKIPTSKQKLKQKDYLKDGKIAVVDQGQSTIGGYTNDDSKILVCKLPVIVFGDHTKIVKIIRFPFAPGADGTKVLQPKEFVNAKLLAFFTKILVHKISDKGYARHYQHIEKQAIKLPPLPEQRAIVAKIEELFSSLDSGIADLKKAQQQLVTYRHSVLKSAFEGNLTKAWRYKNPYTMDVFLTKLIKGKEQAIKSKSISNGKYFPKFEDDELTYKVPNNWLSLPWKTITCNNKYALKRGPFGSALTKSFFVEKGVVVYEQGHAINDDPYRHRYFVTDAKFEELKAFKAQAGDMIVSCSGATLGRICLLPDDADVGIINQALLKIDLDEKIILKKFFVMLFRSETFQRLIFTKALGSAMPNMVGMAELKEIPIPIPSIEEQRQIVQEIESRLSVCEKVEESIVESLEKSKALRQSILKKAFEGKLLSEQELAACKSASDYEPSSVLLKRIKAEKATGVKKAAVSKKRVKEKK
ncbi:restriction endonuclease subunit S [Flavobacterium weaverense]|uniref:Type I restriction enzyme S subunit n=1 Tax=Flavobacterium weaverense TaxID=271156 RepID=A0A3L9ZYI4_9FLAO|nr:restriction endonuclease subunit S [Flavobacterium weaverense]RMA77951.1 type I restriction enzyme S subunit [Flavobacterium weaverense]